MDRNYQDLALQQENIDKHLQDYLNQFSTYKVRKDNKTQNKRTIKFGYAGVNDATLILFFKTTGLTTIQYKTGKNHALGKTLADYLFETVNPSESVNVNLSLKGIDSNDVLIIITDLKAITDQNGKNEFRVTANANKYTIKSINYKDHIVITHHSKNNCLQIQGKPLFCYKNTSYLLSILLDKESLRAVISHRSDEDQLIVHEEVAQVYIQNKYKHSYDKMELVFKDLLVSSYCVKLTSPKLPEYSMLLYADLRVLEGVIKETLAKNELLTDSIKRNIGPYFDLPSVSLKKEYEAYFSNTDTIRALEACYKFYLKQRHSLFHMSDITVASRTISTLGEVMNLSSDIASNIEELYKSLD
jgi:hypothetical protein